ncbi:MAG: hypothetical protein PHN80_01550 [Hespellia sp.]|nr:hypothetical protein [Hespellia sp.]
MKKKKLSFPVKPTLLLAASAMLLIGSTVGSARAALTYYSENYTAQMNMSSIGVTLMEQGAQDSEAKAVSHRNYQDDGAWDETQDGELLSGMLADGEKIVPGKTYTEKLSVLNSGNIDTFVRVVITKSWQKDNAKNTDLSPELIELKLAGNSGWVEDSSASTDERQVFYYTNALTAGQTTNDLTDSIRIDNSIAEKVSKIVDGNTIKYVYDYDGYTFTMDAEVDAVQTHNAVDAIKSAWGVTVTSDGSTLSLQ